MYDFTKDDELFNKWYDETQAPRLAELPQQFQTVLKHQSRAAWLYKTILHMDDVKELCTIVKEIVEEAMA